MSDRVRALVDDAAFACRVATSPADQARGLQGARPLRPHEGLLFPFAVPRTTTFHMGSVAFPIDILFADSGGRALRVVRNAQPGTPDRWSARDCAVVLETAAGALARAQPGASVLRVLGHRFVAQAYDVLRGLTSTDPGRTPDGNTPPEDRFQDSALPDEQPNAMDNPEGDWAQSEGYVTSTPTAPVWPLRAAALDAERFVPAIVEAAARVGVPWRRIPMLQGVARAVIVPETVGRWLHGLGLSDEARDAAFAEITTPEGLDLVGDGFIVAGIADLARPFNVGAIPAIELIKEISWTPAS